MIIPKVIATTISNTTVAKIQQNMINTSALGAVRARFTTFLHSLMLYATINNRALIAAKGKSDNIGDKNKIANNTKIACTTAATGDVPPALTFAAERAIAAVDVIPPKNGAIKLPKPCPKSSPLEWCLVL